MITRDREETISAAERLAKGLKKGDVVLLYGDLGSGKTTFTKGIGKGLGVKDALHINSPTFVLIKEYEADIPLYHLDLYRLDGLRDIEDIAIEEYIYGNGVTVIEWAEKIKDILPEKHIAVRFTIRGEQEREIRIEDLRN
ncbi:MAG: tRNA (adenosine(37)-N6)-threonylcarbamoyltransferase complex ATPase subunit type 1 TsaE [Candidatus Omnitrophica bacterium]|nr:tRNA (adenosine(37)-N6)-threonylcarbamoyltransferase complex ATPase subunit type 1 TsaE [Candidatus Omnitrophota bacterium]